MTLWQIAGATMLFGPFVAAFGYMVFEWSRDAGREQWGDLAIGVATPVAFIAYIGLAAWMLS